MRTFLNRLAGQNLGPSEAIQPRVPSVYEPPQRTWARGFAEGETRERGLGRDEITGPVEPDSGEMERFPRDAREELGEEARGRLPLTPRVETGDETRDAAKTGRLLVSARVSAESSSDRGSPDHLPPNLLSANQKHAGRSAPQSGPVARAVRPPRAETAGERKNGSETSPHSVTLPGRSASDTVERASTTSTSTSGQRFAPSPERDAVFARGKSFAGKSLPSKSIGESTPSATRAEESSKETAWQSWRRIEPKSIGTPILGELPVAETPAPESLVSSRRHPAVKLRSISTGPAASVASPTEPVAASKAAKQATDSAAPVRVMIGRVEVRAVFPAPSPRRAQPSRPRPSLSLDDYLKRGVGRESGPR